MSYKTIDAITVARHALARASGPCRNVYLLLGHINADIDRFLRQSRLIHFDSALQIRAGKDPATVRALLE